jgi:hypothetical protein
MLQAILILALSSVNVPTKTAQIQPCIWPKCEKPVIVAQIQPCIWPKCSKPENVLASLPPANPFQLGAIEPCVWPKKCAANAAL